MQCTCDARVHIGMHLARIEAEVAKLRQAVVEGLYDSRSIVGDAVLRMEPQLKELREFVPRSV